MAISVVSTVCLCNKMPETNIKRKIPEKYTIRGIVMDATILLYSFLALLLS